MDGIIIQQDAVYKTEKGTPVTDSLKVSQVFDKQHKNVLKAIRNLAAQNLAAKNWFFETTYVDMRGQTQPMFIMTRDGFSLLAMGLTGAKAMQFKVAFIEQFNAMEKVVRQAMQPTTAPAIPNHLRKHYALQRHRRNKSSGNKSRLKPMRPVSYSHKRLKPPNNPCLSVNLPR